MQTIELFDFQENLETLLVQITKHHKTLRVHGEAGNAIVISEEEYNGILETLRIFTSPELKEKLLKGRATPLSECVQEDETHW